MLPELPFSMRAAEGIHDMLRVLRQSARVLLLQAAQQRITADQMQRGQLRTLLPFPLCCEVSCGRLFQ